MLGELQALGHAVRLVVHPIIDVERNATGELLRFAAPDRRAIGDASRESFVHVHVPLIRDVAVQATLAENLAWLLNEVAARDRRLERDARAARAARSLISAATTRSSEAVTDETIAFLEWLDEGNFVFLGMREYAYDGSVGGVDRDARGKRARAADATRA